MLITSLLGSGEPWMFYLSYSCVSGLGSGMFIIPSCSCSKAGCRTGADSHPALLQALRRVCAYIQSAIQWYVRQMGPFPKPFASSYCVFCRIPDRLFLFPFSYRSLSVQPMYHRQTDRFAGGNGVRRFAPGLRFWCIALSLFFITAAWNILVPIIKTARNSARPFRNCGLAYGHAHRSVQRGRRLIVGIFSDRVGAPPPSISCP